MNEDVWPLRNLGPKSEHWGRTIEGAIDSVWGRYEQNGERNDGLNRYSAASSATLAETITGLSELASDIEQAILATPRYFVSNDSSGGFAIGTGWNTVARCRVSAISGFPKGDVTARGTVFTEQDFTPISGFEWPFPTSSVSSEYGPRPPLPFHNGIDLAQPTGTPIPSASAGVVTVKQYYEDYGNYVRVDVSEATGVAGSWLGYAHLNSPSPLVVGQVIAQGDIIGPVGSTGYSTGPHLHWETAPGGDRIDPRLFMDIFGGTTSSTVLEVQARIVLNGTASPVFRPYTEVGLGPKQIHVPIFGRSYSSLASRDEIDAALQVRSIGGKIAARNTQIASLTIQGGFKQ